MAGQRQPPEDSKRWKDMAPDMKTPVNLVCKVCKKKIEYWHCAESGCPWCAKCGEDAKQVPHKKG